MRLSESDSLRVTASAWQSRTLTVLTGRLPGQPSFSDPAHMLLSDKPRTEEGLDYGAGAPKPVVLGSESFAPAHPLGLKPIGNLYIASGPNARESAGLFQLLPDELLSYLAETLGSRPLRLLGYTCKFLFALCSSDELWKGLFIEIQAEHVFPFTWEGSWRSSLLSLSRAKQARIDCSSVYSDVLHRPLVCKNLDLIEYGASIPQANQISRLEDLSYDDFASKWSRTPFILTKCIHDWPLYKSWDMQTLVELYPDVAFRAESVDWPLSTYYGYMQNNHDESPLYLFDRKFAEKMQLQTGSSREDKCAYWKPECFGIDLFELLGEERPAHRWLIIGPERSGSTFHKDPNGTSAWNAVVRGAKYWIMFPPTAAVPGVYVSPDQSEVTSPLSIAEWLLEFHAEARQLPGCVEGVCGDGEILHVPSGWWHLVVNLQSGIALTQNFVPPAHLAEVLSFLKDRPEQVTGFPSNVDDPYGLFTERLRIDFPELLRDAMSKLERTGAAKKRVWDIAIGGDDDTGGSHKRSSTFGFEFAFGADEEESA